MPRQTIGTGTTANDGTGDTLRQAGTKINANFVELYNILGGDSGAVGSITAITDSGATIFGSSKFTRISAKNPASDLRMEFPDSSGSIVIDSAIQTLTHKTISVDSVSGNIVSGLQNNSFVMTDSNGRITPQLTAKAIPTGVIIGDSDTQTLFSKTLDSATINNPRIVSRIYDANGADLVGITATGSSVNHIVVANAATGNNPSISATGTDTNVNMSLSGKADGSVVLAKAALGSSEMTANGDASTTASYIIANKGSTLNIGLPVGTIAGEQKFFTNKGSGSAVITPASFAQGTSVTLVTNGACQFIFDGTNWFLSGFGRSADVTIA